MTPDPAVSQEVRNYVEMHVETQLVAAFTPSLKAPTSPLKMIVGQEFQHQMETGRVPITSLELIDVEHGQGTNIHEFPRGVELNAATGVILGTPAELEHSHHLSASTVRWKTQSQHNIRMRGESVFGQTAPVDFQVMLESLPIFAPEAWHFINTETGKPARWEDNFTVGTDQTRFCVVYGIPDATSVVLQSGAIPAGCSWEYQQNPPQQDGDFHDDEPHHRIKLTGAPTAAGSVTATFAATNANGTTTFETTWTVNPAPTESE